MTNSQDSSTHRISHFGPHRGPPASPTSSGPDSYFDLKRSSWASASPSHTPRSLRHRGDSPPKVKTPPERSSPYPAIRGPARAPSPRPTSKSHPNSTFTSAATTVLPAGPLAVTPSPLDPRSGGLATSASLSSIGQVPNFPFALDRAGLSLPDLSRAVTPDAVHPPRSSTLPQTAGRRRGLKVVDSHRFRAFDPHDILHGAWPATLFLDLRPHSVYSSSAGRLLGAINVCVPSTLLRRPNYSLAKIAETLPSAGERSRFRAFDRLERIVVLDQDASALLVDQALHSLLAKLDREGFTGELGWLRGGWSAVIEAAKSSKDLYQVVDFAPLSPKDADVMSRGSSSSESSLSSQRSNESLSPSTSTSSSPDGPTLDCRTLPMAAFLNVSTQEHRLVTDEGATARSERPPSLMKPWGDQPVSAQQATGSARRVAANPFFDNIRQNQEGLSLTTSLASLKPFEVDPIATQPHVLAQLPPFLIDLLQVSPLERAERLAREFHEVEEAEQRRLQAILRWHATEGSVSPQSPGYHPLSIAAGIEKGHLNRYRNMFPYEHARVRLNLYAPTETDYINASHITLRGARRDYIATQGPVAAAYGHFWQLVVQEEVQVIVMLTHFHEGGREKCGNYFRDGRYGQVTVETEPEPGVDLPAPSFTHGGGFFNNGEGKPASPSFRAGTSLHSPSTKPASRNLIRRTLLVRHDDDPIERPPRRITHIQYLGWPDFDVPPDMGEVLDLIQQVNRIHAQLSGPILAHCSAGVGRTGCYILVDAVVQALREDRLRGRASSPMDVDAPFPMLKRALSLNKTIPTSSAMLHLPSRGRSTPPLNRTDPIRGVVDDMRELRMSMVANLSQFNFCYEAVLEQTLRDLRAEGRI